MCRLRMRDGMTQLMQWNAVRGQPHQKRPAPCSFCGYGEFPKNRCKPTVRQYYEKFRQCCHTSLLHYAPNRMRVGQPNVEPAEISGPPCWFYGLIDFSQDICHFSNSQIKQSACIG